MDLPDSQLARQLRYRLFVLESYKQREEIEMSEHDAMQPMHDADCWECKWGRKGKPDKDGTIPLTCTNDSAFVLQITESVWVCNCFKLERAKK